MTKDGIASNADSSNTPSKIIAKIIADRLGANFAQYEHLSYLADIIEKHKQLSTVLGNDYMISPDIVVYRELCEDEEINCEKFLIDDSICKISVVVVTGEPLPSILGKRLKDISDLPLDLSC